MLDVRKIRLILELRESGISNAEVLSAIEKIPREKFISEAYRNQAYENIALPIENNQTISQPYVVAKMTELLDVKSNHKVLEIGTGSGYQCAVLSILARRVYTIERIKNLHEGSNNIFDKFVYEKEQDDDDEIINLSSKQKQTIIQSASKLLHDKYKQILHDNFNNKYTIDNSSYNYKNIYNK